MAADFIHPGHINLINNASELGEVTVGLLTDKAVAEYKRAPILKYEQRKIIIKNIKGVTHIMKQTTSDYTNNLREFKPDIVVHGDDWKKDSRINIREKVIEVLAEWGGQLIEPPSTKGFSSTNLLTKYLEIGVTPDNRRKKLKELLEVKPLIRICEAHNGLSALIVEKTRIHENKKLKEFDGMWLSSLTDSTAKGKPDISCVDFTSRGQIIDQIMDVTTKPIVFDGDNGGDIGQFKFMVKTLERTGVSAVIIEDKLGAKKNSLLELKQGQEQDSIENFSQKIIAGKKSQITGEFMIIARIESLILKAGQKDAIKRAKAFIEAGADAIMIHSKDKEPKAILEFCNSYNQFDVKVPLVVVPSTYDQITESELKDAGVNIVIYANHLLRSAFPAMVKTAECILKNERALETKELCMPIKDLITLIPEE